MTQPIDAIASAFPSDRVLRKEDLAGSKEEGFFIHGMTPQEAAAVFRKFANMLEGGQLSVQGLSMAPRGRGKGVVLQAFTLWFGSRS